ncbi:hypothetical protein PFISCL1PPCAC_10457, partial [Pristionchus fissidentatus]
SSGGALPPTSFNHFPYLFPTQPHFFTPNQRMKMKRQRQRVDAGEPRNSYQQPRVPPKQDNASPIQQTTALPLNVTQLFPNLPWMQMVNQLSDQKDGPEEGMESIVETHENEIQDAMEEAPVSNASASESTSSSASSSSRRKSNFPKKTSPELEDNEDDDCGEGSTTDNDGGVKKEVLDHSEENIDKHSTAKLNEIIETQKNFYSSIIEQQKSMSDGKVGSDYGMMAAFLKQAILTSVVGSVDEIVSQWVEREKRKADGDEKATNSVLTSTIGGSTLPFTGGIFPPSPFMSMALTENERKRKMESPSIRSKFARENEDTKIPSGLFNYFPGAMVGPSIFDKSRLTSTAIPSPSLSEDNSDYDPNDPDCQLSGADLKKSKLMFFYTRYPNPTNLKQYFPEFQFRKKSSGQLVKWFSNFREFYYNQMEKYAKEAVAKGIKNREEIVVTKDSEIFKQLNQHYNRNNHFEAPERFVWVVQESLREFHEAILLGKHDEPSWKKPIYKVICRYDDPIPDFFKDNSFLDRLEQ